MAGDCPHHTQLQSMFSHWDQSALIATQHDSYLTIIDELKHELNCLSGQVAMVQKEFRDYEQEDDKNQSLETSLRDLASQNDLLQQALEQTTKDKHEALELEQNNDSLKCQIEHQQCTINEKEQCIAKMSGMLKRLQCETRRKSTEWCPQSQSQSSTNDQELRDARAQLHQANCKIQSMMCDLERCQKQERFLHSETRKLNDELIESKRKNGDINLQAHRLASLLKTQEAHRTELSRKYEVMEKNYEDQAKKLRAANVQLNCLQERLVLMEKRHDEHTMERNLLRDEVLALKEKEACLLGKQKSISEQLLKTEKELYTAHDVMKEQQCILQRNDFAHSEIVKRLQETSNNNKRQLNSVCEDYKCLEDEYKKQNEVRKQNEKVIESFRKWKEAQMKADEATRASFKQYEEHIRLLLEEKQKFLEQYRDLHRDYCILQNELERWKMCSYSTSAARLNTSENSMTNRMELIRRTSRRISQQSNSIREDDISQEATCSKSTPDTR